jgi:hypothetical protein
MRGKLFTQEYLGFPDGGITETSAWRQLDASTLAASEAHLAEILRAFPVAGTPNEAVTEKDLIWPVLEALGWDALLPQQTTSGHGRLDVPDVLLFADQAAKQAAQAERQEQDRYRHGAAIVEAKRWQRNLDRAESQATLDGGAPSTQMLRYLTRAEVASDGRIRWGVLTNGRHWRLYYQGARSRAEEFLELDLPVLLGVPGVQADLGAAETEHRDHFVRVFLLLFRRQAFLPDPVDPEGRTFHLQALDRSREWEERVSTGLGAVVFQRVFPDLLAALIEHDPERPEPLTAAYLDEVRRAGLTFLYRLLFVLFAEDRNLLPVQDRRYDDYSLRRIRHDLAGRLDARDAFSATAGRYYSHLQDLFRAVGEGDSSLGVPPYDGGLFEPGSHPLLVRVRLPDAALAPLIDALSRREEGGRRRLINYRDLSVQHLGSIYERLLQFEPVVDDAGAVALKPNLFARKGSGSYYTHDDLVRLILRTTLEPLLAESTEAFAEAAAELGAASRPRSRKDRLALLAARDPAARILDLKVCDPAMGSGHFLVSLVDYLADQVLEQMAAAETAVAWAPRDSPYRSPVEERIRAIRETILDSARQASWSIDPEQLDDRHVVRRILLKRVIHGVDKNPMAVELAKVALWLHTFTAGAPLSFLDHHLRTGDSLYGEWLDEVTADFDRLGALFFRSVRTQVATASQVMNEVAALSDTDVAEVHRSRELFQDAEESLDPLRRILDFWQALRWLPQEGRRAPHDRPGVRALVLDIFGNLGEVLARGWVETADPGQKAEAGAVNDLLGQVRRIVERERFLHWELAFPNVWRELQPHRVRGGFDAVIGNPPWDRLKLQEVEWFAAREPEIARSPRAADRKRKVQQLEKRDAPLWREYLEARDAAETAARVARESGHYPRLARGDLNIYSLFVERAQRLVHPRGVVGLLVPSGIASDLSASDFFQAVATGGRLRALYDFENKKVFFPDVDSRFKFSAFVFGGEDRSFERADCAFFLHAVSELDEPERSFPLGPKDFAAVNPNTGTAPVFRGQRDAEITTGIYRRLPILVDRRGEEARATWPVRYVTMFHMTNDSGLFRTRAELEADGWYPVEGNRWRKGEQVCLPLYVGRMIRHYDHRAASVVVNPDNVHNVAGSEALPVEAKKDPNYLPTPQYWVAAKHVSRPDHPCEWAIGFRDVARVTDERTIIAAAVPALCAGNKLPFLLGSGLGRGEYATLAPLLLAQLNSFVLDYVARQKIQSTNANWYIVEQFPVLPPERFEDTLGGRKIGDFVRQEVLRLSYTAVDLAPMARDLRSAGVGGDPEADPFPWDEEDRRHRLARLDAIFFHLYGIDRHDAAYILDQFPIVQREDQQTHGRYFTKDLILAYMNAVAVGDLETRVTV